MMQLDKYEKSQMKTDVPVFRAGDTIKVFTKIKEGEKERIQIFEGIVIRKRGSLNRETFTVRKMSYGVGVERVFPLHSPMIDKIEVKTRGEVRRSKLYYLRELSGKAARISEKKEWQVAREAAIAELTDEEIASASVEKSVEKHAEKPAKKKAKTKE